jgi:hypothetical protein
MSTATLLPPLFAATDDAVVREIRALEFRRLAQFDDPRVLWVLLAVVAVVMFAYVVWLYRRESTAIPPVLRVVFPCLRMIAWAGVVLFFLGLESRVDQQTVTDSQVVLLVDTSQSMSVADVNAESRLPQSRGEAVAQVLQDSPLVESPRLTAMSAAWRVGIASAKVFRMTNQTQRKMNRRTSLIGPPHCNRAAWKHVWAMLSRKPSTACGVRHWPV